MRLARLRTETPHDSRPGDAEPTVVELVSPVDRDDQRRERLGEPGVGERARVDPSHAGHGIDELADEPLRVVVVGAEERVGLHVSVERHEAVRADRVEAGHDRDALGHEARRELGRRAVPRLDRLPRPPPDRRHQRARGIEHDLAGSQRIGDRCVDLDHAGERHRDGDHVGAQDRRRVLPALDLHVVGPAFPWLAATVSAARSADLEPIVTRCPAPSRRRASPKPSLPVPPTIATSMASKPTGTAPAARCGRARLRLERLAQGMHGFGVDRVRVGSAECGPRRGSSSSGSDSRASRSECSRLARPADASRGSAAVGGRDCAARARRGADLSTARQLVSRD